MRKISRASCAFSTILREYPFLAACCHDRTCCSDLPYKRMDPNTPSVVSGPLRLAIKYEIEKLRTRLVHQVVADWPITIHDWDRQQAEFDAIRKQLSAALAEGGPRTFLADLIPEPASAIAFAREFNCPEILPAAFYRLSTMNISSDRETSFRARADARACCMLYC